MEHVRLGRSGLKVSRLCLGTMTFGLQCDEETSVAILDRAAEAGVTFLDTADAYPLGAGFDLIGRTEEILGRWLAGRRDDYVATMVLHPHRTAAVPGRQRPPPRDERGRGVAAPARDRLHRPLPAPPLRPRTRRWRRRWRRLTTSCGRARCATSAARTGSPTRWRALGRARRAGSSASPRCSAVQPPVPRVRARAVPAVPGGGPGCHPLQPDRREAALGQARPRAPAGRGHPLHAHGAGGNHVPGALLERAPSKPCARWGIAEQAGLAMPTVAWVLAHPAVTSPLVGASRPEQLEATLGRRRCASTRPSCPSWTMSRGSSGGATRRAEAPRAPGVSAQRGRRADGPGRGPRARPLSAGADPGAASPRRPPRVAARPPPGAGAGPPRGRATASGSPC